MSESFRARVQVEQLRAGFDAAQASADEQEAVLRRLQSTGDPRAAAAAATHADRQRFADEMRSSLDSAEDELTAALEAEPPLFASDNTDPIALLPVRLETIWFDATSLRVRVYPDDLHLAQHDPELTPDEARLGAAYWRAPGPEAWQLVQAGLRPARAAWAVRASRPGAPPPVVRPEAAERPPRTVSMPRRWRFVGLVGGEVVVDKLGRPVPDPLPIGMLRTEDGWEVDWFQALKAGMGVELTFTDGLDRLDELFVIGVREQPAAAGGAQLHDLLLGHAFGGGLDLLKAGTTTNNTPRARSGWSSQPSFPGPDPDPDPSGEPAPGERSAAEALAVALGLPDAGPLLGCPGASDAEHAAVAGLSLLTWCSLGKGFAEAAATHLDLSAGGVRGVDQTRPWRAIRDHLAEHVRGRGPLPVLRAGRQPYGILPATSLSDWRAERDRDVDGRLAPWLRRLRHRWLSVLPNIPRVQPDLPVDQVAVDALTRLPVATGLSMRRLDGPGFAVPKTVPDQPPTELGVPGLPPDGTLRWTTNDSDGTTDLGWGLDEKTGTPLFVARLAPDPSAIGRRARATADYFQAIAAFLAGELTAEDYDRDWPVELSSGRDTPPRPSTLFDLADDTDVFGALLFLPNWAFMDGDDGDNDPVRQAIAVTGDVDQLVADVLDEIDDPDRPDKITAAARSVPTLARLQAALRAIAAVPGSRLPELLLEVIDVYSHRLDAWITSLASRRLAALRADGVAGVRIGGYGWVEDLSPPVTRDEVDLGEEGPVLLNEQDGYIHAPSLHHAATAAVLRSGFLGHPGEESFAVDLSSRRARIARWLLGGVRQGQSLGSLLGYRFERALHDAELDTEIANFRRVFPAPTVPPPPGTDPADELWARSTEAIAARNVVDGMALARAGAGAASVADDPAAVAPILDDLADALDAVGDLLLAESVHQLVGGNPLRAGMAADTLGRGTDVPDTFQVLRTPHRARAITHRVAALLSASATATGWPTDALSKLEPVGEAWVAHLMGPAAGWTLTGVLGADRRFVQVVDRLGLGALSTVLESAGAEHPQLRQAVAKAEGAEPEAAVAFDGPGWAELQDRAARIRSMLATAQPLRPDHLPGTRPVDGDADIDDVRRRLAAFATDPTVAANPAAAALAALATGGPPGADVWLTQARAALADVLGADVPLLPALNGSVPERIAAPGADVGEWLQRQAQVRPSARLIHEALTLAGVRTGRPERLHVVQDPAGTGDAWIGGGFPADRRPAARSHLLWHAPREVPTDGPLAGLLLDEWVELLPGGDRLREGAEVSSPPESELTGVAFHYDRPDAKAPHALLLAVPPDLDRGWTADGLLQVLRETLELAKLRAVDLADLPLLGDLIPAIRLPSSAGAIGRVLSTVETKRPRTDPDGPFRFEPGYRTPDVDAGLAARVHDSLWLLTRQWQFGEFAAQDAGSPAVVRMSGSSAPIDAWRPLDAPGWTRYDRQDGPLDLQVESEPVVVDERMRAEGGVHLLRMLDDAGQLASAAGSLAPHLLPAGGAGGNFVGGLSGRVPDAAAVAAAIDAGRLTGAIGPIAGQWRTWWAGLVADRGPDSFDPQRLEHALELSTRGAVLRGPEYLGDGLDWFSLDVDPDGEPAPEGDHYTFTDEGLPSTVRFGGMPADRFWEMEDARIDLGSTDVSALDTGRLLLISFATVFGNDWYLVPVEVPIGSLSVLDQLLVRDVFGRNHLVRRAGRDDPAWSLFTLSSPDPDHPAASGLLILPTERGQVGEQLERVGLVRDELANLAWAVQHRYTDGRGEAVDRRDRWRPEQFPPAKDVPVYRVQTEVPDYWFPLVPEPVRPGMIRFRLGSLSAPGVVSRIEGRLLTEGQRVHEEEVPREGALVGRRPVLARWFDGSWHLWVRREKGAGTGESSSGLAFDTVRPSEPWPE